MGVKRPTQNSQAGIRIDMNAPRNQVTILLRKLNRRTLILTLFTISIFSTYIFYGYLWNLAPQKLDVKITFPYIPEQTYHQLPIIREPPGKISTIFKKYLSIFANQSDRARIFQRRFRYAGNSK
jgi:hypothetical protein